MIHVQHNSKVYIQTGVWNKQQIIDVSALHEKLGEIMCQSLPGFHALTGCDFNPALFQEKKIQNFDSSTLPPSQAELTQHLLRTKYIATIWKNAHKKIPSHLLPENCGWILVEENYQFKWFDGPQLPSTIQDIIDTGTNEGDEGLNAESESNEEEYGDSEGDITSESDSDCECD
ncbi:unnamed protein product [Ceutorhynchus assimilis]|uniref:Uncharacterized protein n=1 Tax=Ceutorhynchus assimilis TaxID=467358 RepID=A0A9N9QD96_9CUCU|nr:unnamed protein product [Ceutorhynchus assimilis]